MRSIVLYIVQNLMNVSAAEGHADAFLNAMEALSYRASTVKTVLEQPWGDMGFRRISVRNYYIYIKIYEDRKEVSVLDIIYRGRDQRKSLSEGDYEEKNPETNS